MTTYRTPPYTANTALLGLCFCYRSVRFGSKRTSSPEDLESQNVNAPPVLYGCATRSLTSKTVNYKCSKTKWARE